MDLIIVHVRREMVGNHHGVFGRMSDTRHPDSQSNNKGCRQ
jgi:hypothetical protein